LCIFFCEFAVINGGEEVETESEALSAVSVSVGDDLESLAIADDVFAGDAFAGDALVFGFVPLGQRLFFAALFGHDGIGVEFVQAQIAGIDQRRGRRGEPYLGTLEEVEIVAAAFLVCRADDLAGTLVYDQLSFLRVALLLAGVKTPLLCLGRSQGLAVASTITTSNCMLLFKSALRPGSEKDLL
jgi:hypothetical protein